MLHCTEQRPRCWLLWLTPAAATARGAAALCRRCRYGTRLRPLTLTVPKPIIEFGRRGSCRSEQGRGSVGSGLLGQATHAGWELFAACRLNLHALPRRPLPASAAANRPMIVHQIEVRCQEEGRGLSV